MKRLQPMALALCLMLVAWLYAEKAAFAQEVTATITGTVTDPTGAGVVGAAVTAKAGERTFALRRPDFKPLGIRVSSFTKTRLLVSTSNSRSDKSAKPLKSPALPRP